MNGTRQRDQSVSVSKLLESIEERFQKEHNIEIDSTDVKWKLEKLVIEHSLDGDEAFDTVVRGLKQKHNITDSDSAGSGCPHCGCEETVSYERYVNRGDGDWVIEFECAECVTLLGQYPLDDGPSDSSWERCPTLSTPDSTPFPDL